MMPQNAGLTESAILIGSLIRYDNMEAPGWAEVSFGEERRWARISTGYHNELGGMFCLPEIGSEVLLSQISDSNNVLVLLAALRPAGAPPGPDAPYLPEPETKSFTARNGCTITISEKEKTIEVCTPAGNNIRLNDEQKSVRLQDQNGNQLLLSEAGISITTGKDLLLKASGRITVEAEGPVAMTSQADWSIRAMNVTLTGDIGFRAAGNARAELSASGQTSVKGAMVMIN
jgi:hypothetical protein